MWNDIEIWEIEDVQKKVFLHCINSIPGREAVAMYMYISDWIDKEVFNWLHDLVV